MNKTKRTTFGMQSKKSYMESIHSKRLEQGEIANDASIYERDRFL